MVLRYVVWEESLKTFKVVKFLSLQNGLKLPVKQWSATTGPRTGADLWRVRYWTVYFSKLGTLEYICNVKRNCVWAFYGK